MSDESDKVGTTESAGGTGGVCAECGKEISAEEVIRTENSTFCPSCYQQLRQALQTMIDQQSQDINYIGAVGGGLLGGLLGALVWWGFTALTHFAIGFIAILIGFAAGKGVVMLSGNKRAASLQALAVVISIACFALASYWVNRTFLLQAVHDQGMEGTLPLIPNPSLLIEVVKLDVGLWDVAFLGITIWESWKIPKPISLA